MSANIDAKKQVVADITERIKNSKSVIVVDYKGLTVIEDTELRSAFRKAGVDYKVLKNTLVRRAFNDIGVKDFDNDLNGPTAVAFGNDETGAAKVLAEAVKKYNEKITVKSGFVDNEYVDVKGVTALANMPSREVLISKMLGSMQSPVTKFACVLSNVLRSVVLALNAVSEKKAQENN